MPETCSVPKCKSVFDKNMDISFHCFPKDEEICQLWLDVIGIKPLKWDRRPRICSKHFRKCDFVAGGNVQKLSKYAVPIMNMTSVSQNMQAAVSAHTAVIDTEIGVDTRRDWAECKENVPHQKAKMPLAINNKRAMVSTSKVLQERGIWTMQTTNIENTHSILDEVDTSITSIDAVDHSTVEKVSVTSFDFQQSNMTSTSEERTAEDELDTLTGPELKKRKRTATPHKSTIGASGKNIDVLKRCKCVSYLQTIDTLENEVAYLKRELKRSQESSEPKPFFDIEKFADDDKKILYYTGFQTIEIFEEVFKWVSPRGKVTDIDIYASTSETARIKQHLCKLTAKNQFFLTLVTRTGMPLQTIADLFSISKSTACNIFLAWVNVLYLRLGVLDIWPNRDILINRASQRMKQNYPKVIGSIDCTEFFIQRPSSLIKQSQCYSNYKGTTTLKSLLMIDPAGAILYASPLYTGSISDKAIIQDSGFIDILKEKVKEGQILPGDIILADKGFNVNDLFEAINLELNIPIFRVGGTQFTSEQVLTTRKIATERIHVERAINRLKNYNILSSKMTISSLGHMEQIYAVCVLLSNFRYGLIKET